MSDGELSAQVAAIVVEHLGCDAEQVQKDALLIDDLGADSLDVIELSMAFEEAFDVRIEDDETEKLDTFGACVDLIDAKLKTPRG